jgi:sodium-dependent dicarboxylate transporter 2/3/5
MSARLSVALPARTTRSLALAAGPATFLILWLVPPGGLTGASAGVLALGAWMAIWWITECLPLAVTALLPVAVFPLLGVMTIRQATAPFANEVVFLYLGGFLIAAALQQWRAHERIALSVIGRVGTDSRRLVLGVMLATAFVSMWISNTATAAMMYPIALAIGTLYGEGATARSQRIALLLGVAFAASIGGMATLIGTPPNLILAGAARELLGVSIDFFEFLTYGLPAAILILPVCWVLLVFVFHRERISLDATGRAALDTRRSALGALGGGERATLIVFVAVAVAWFFREPKVIGGLTIFGLTTIAPGLTDAGIAHRHDRHTFANMAVGDPQHAPLRVDAHADCAQQPVLHLRREVRQLAHRIDANDFSPISAAHKERALDRIVRNALGNEVGFGYGESHGRLARVRGQCNEHN